MSNTLKFHSVKKIALLFSLLLSISCAANHRHPYPAEDQRIKVMGRHINDEGAVKFGTSGVTFFMKFRGRRMKVKLEDEFRDSTNYNWFTVVIDSSQSHRFRTRRGQKIYTLADSLSAGVHTLALSKATEGQNGHNRLDSVYTGELLPAGPLPDRKIEFIGNSITAGYGLDNRTIACDEGTWFDPTHAWYAYGPQLARRLHAQWMNSAVSGIGVHRNWNSLGPVMPGVWKGVYMEYTDHITPWNFDRYTPDLVVIALGTNDFSEGGGKQPRPELNGPAFVKDYNHFVDTVQGEYPQVRILLLNSPMLSDQKKKQLSQYLQQVINQQEAAGDSAITRFAFDHHYTDGCDGHPSFAQQRKMADELEPKLRALMNW